MLRDIKKVFNIKIRCEEKESRTKIKDKKIKTVDDRTPNTEQ